MNLYVKPIKPNDLPQLMRKQARETPCNPTALRDAYKKLDGLHVLLEAPKGAQFSAPVHITVSVWRIRENWDADNVETKGLIDGLVKSRIISDDTIKEVPVVTKKGYRCKTRAEEKTIIEVVQIKE